MYGRFYRLIGKTVAFIGTILLLFPVLLGIFYIVNVNDPVNRVLLDSGLCAGLPCTLTRVIHSNVGDTALRSFLNFKWWISDTASDSIGTFYCPTHWDITLKN